METSESYVDYEAEKKLWDDNALEVFDHPTKESEDKPIRKAPVSKARIIKRKQRLGRRRGGQRTSF